MGRTTNFTPNSTPVTMETDQRIWQSGAMRSPIARTQSARLAAVIATAFVGLGFLAGCSGSAAGSTMQGSWTLVEAEDATGTFVDPGTPITLVVDGNRASGTSGCNQYSAEISGTAGSGTPADTKFGVAVQTLKACDEKIMKLEQRYTDAFGAVTKGELTDAGELILTGTDVTLRFEH